MKIFQRVEKIWNGHETQGQTHDIEVCYESDFMMSLNDDKQTEIIDASTTIIRLLFTVVSWLPVPLV